MGSMEGDAMTDEQQRKVFARNLTKYVNQSGKQQREIAEALGFNVKTFNGWCRALSMPTVGKVQAIADYFGIGKSELLDADQDDELRLTFQEQDLVIAFRKSDVLTKQMVLRLLNIEPESKENSSIA